MKKFKVFTTIQAQLIIEAKSETEAMERAERVGFEAMAGVETNGKPIAAAREADEV